MSPEESIRKMLNETYAPKETKSIMDQLRDAGGNVWTGPKPLPRPKGGLIHVPENEPVLEPKSKPTTRPKKSLGENIQMDRSQLIRESVMNTLNEADIIQAFKNRGVFGQGGALQALSGNIKRRGVMGTLFRSSALNPERFRSANQNQAIDAIRQGVKKGISGKELGLRPHAGSVGVMSGTETSYDPDTKTVRSLRKNFGGEKEVGREMSKRTNLSKPGDYTSRRVSGPLASSIGQMADKVASAVIDRRDSLSPTSSRPESAVGPEGAQQLANKLMRSTPSSTEFGPVGTGRVVQTAQQKISKLQQGGAGVRFGESPSTRLYR